MADGRRVAGLAGGAGGLDDEPVVAGAAPLLAREDVPVYGPVAAG